MAERKAQLKIGADASGVEAGIGKAKKAINSLGATVADANSKSSKSIDAYVKRLQDQQAQMGKSSREIELYKLAMRGASNEQLKAADSAIKLKEAYERGERIGANVRRGLIALGVAAVAGVGAAAVAVDGLVKKASDFQGMAEKIGDSAESIASFAVAAAVSGTAMETITAASVKLTKGLIGVDDETKEAGAAIKALGLDLEAFKKLTPTDQIETVAKALAGFEDGASKTAVAMALFGKSGAELLPFLNDLGTSVGRQNVLTSEQIALADEYSKKQARLRAELDLQAQSIAISLLPAYTDLQQAIVDLAKDQEIAAAAQAILSGAMKAGIVIFQTIAIVASDVAFVFNMVGSEIGAIAAQLAALARLDFRGFRAISEAVREDAERARAVLDKFQTRIMAIGQPLDPEAAREAARFGRQAAQARDVERPALRFTGAANKDNSKSQAEQEARAQLAYDLDLIKRNSEVLTSAYGNAQRIMEAQRAAGLLDEAEYYDAKLAFLRLNADEQERALQAEIARLQQEKVTGKDRIDNARKVADAEAKLAKVRADAITTERVLAIEAAAAVTRHASALLSARQAAQDYFDTINRQQQRELQGVGQGDRARSLGAGLSQIEDRYADQRRDLENQRAVLEMEGKFTAEARRQYEQRLAIINEFQNKSRDSYIAYYADLVGQQRNWSLGANRALQNYYDESMNTFKGVEQAVTRAFQGMEDALVQFVQTGKLDFKSLADSIIADISRIIVRQQITGPLAGMLGGNGAAGGSLLGFLGGLGGGGVLGGKFGPDNIDVGGGWNPAGVSSGGSLVSWLASLFGGARASGGPVQAGKLYEVNERGPELLNVAGRQYLMMGDQSGQVTPARRGGSEKTIHVHVNVAAQPGMSRATALQQGAAIGEGIRRSVSRAT